MESREEARVWLRKHATLDWSQPRRLTMPKSKETPAQKIKRLKRELSDEKLKNEILNKIIDLSDQQYGTSIRKKYSPKQTTTKANKSLTLLLWEKQTSNLSGTDTLSEQRAKELAQVKPIVNEIRRKMPRLETRKLYYLLQEDFKRSSSRIGRDDLFKYLRSQNMLVRPAKSYTKTTYSKHWLKKYPNLMREVVPTHPEEYFVSDITYIKSNQRTHYISMVTDAFSRKIMGYELRDEMYSENVVKALEMVVTKLKTTLSLIHHSDRGLQYFLLPTSQV